MTFTERAAQFPNEIPVDPDKATRALFVSLDQSLFASHGVAESFRQLDDDYQADRLSRLQFMANSVMRLDERPVDISFVHDKRDAASRDIMVVMSPLNDGRPETTPETLKAFVDKPKPSRKDVSTARPNSWNPATKLDIDYQFGHAENVGMPRLQVFAPEAQAFTRSERRAIASGDMTPYGKLVTAALDAANRVRRETYGGEGGYNQVHFFAAGMAPKALGAAVHLTEATDYEIGSVVAMNLALGEQSLGKLMADYAGRRMVGEAAKITLPPEHTRIREPLIRREIDGHGAEFSMRRRQARVLMHFRMARAIMNAEQGADYIERLLENESTVTVANAFNEAMVSQTSSLLPAGDRLFHTIDIVGVEGKEVGMMANEHAGLVAVVNAAGLKNHITSH